MIFFGNTESPVRHAFQMKNRDERSRGTTHIALRSKKSTRSRFECQLTLDSRPTHRRSASLFWNKDPGGHHSSAEPSSLAAMDLTL